MIRRNKQQNLQFKKKLSHRTFRSTVWREKDEGSSSNMHTVVDSRRLSWCIAWIMSFFRFELTTQATGTWVHAGPYRHPVSGEFLSLLFQISALVNFRMRPTLLVGTWGKNKCVYVWPVLLSAASRLKPSFFGIGGRGVVRWGLLIGFLTGIF